MWSNPFPHKKVRHPLLWLFFCPCSPLFLLPAFGLSNARDVVYIGIDPLVVVSSTNSNLQKRQWAFLLLESSAGVMLVFWFFCHGLITVLSQVKDVGFEIISWLLSPNICKGRGEEEVLFEQCFFFALLSCQNGLLSILWSQITQVIFYERLLSFLLLPLPPPISAFLGRVH